MPGKTTSTGRSSAPGKRGPADLDQVLEALRRHLGSLDGLAIRDPLDLVLFSHLVLHIPLADAGRAFQRFKTQFVDWNEVRISSAKEVQEVLRHGDDPLELAIFIKEFLNRLFTDHHQIGIEFLRECSLSEIRGFFKKIPGFAESTVHLLLADIKEYPVLPLEAWMHPCVERLALTKASATPLQKQKDVHEKAPREGIRELHFYLVEHARQTCVVETSDMDCPHCVIQDRCPYPRKKGARRKTAKKAKRVTKGASRNGASKRSK